MSPRIPILTGIVICGQVKLLEVIGTGGAGIVYRGIKQDGSLCAVKCLRNSDRALHEVNLHRSVSDHPNIINIDETFAIGDFMFIVMEHCPGGDLLTAIEDGMFQDQDDLVKSVFIQLLDALRWCHENKVSHRDIKPENVLCNTDCSQIRLADFGLSCKEAFSVEFLNGTPGYLSPECIGSERQFLPYSTVKTDIWALGVVLASIITGHHPWEEALSTDWRFSAYQKDREILLSMLPISLEIHNILKRIFTLDAAERITLSELRESIIRVQTFFPSDRQDNTPVLRVVNRTTGDRLDSSSSDCDDSSSFYSQNSKRFPSTCSIPQPKRSLSCSDSDLRHLYLNLGEDSNSDSSQVVRWIRRSWTSISPESVQYSKQISLSSLYDDYWDIDAPSEPESSAGSFYSDIGEPVHKPKLPEFDLPDSCLVVDHHTLL